MPKNSAGLLMYKIESGIPWVLLVHPGGPFWKDKDIGVWSVPKGEVEGEEDLLVVAKREFEEETGIKPEGDFKYLTSVTREDGKVVTVYVFVGICDPAHIKSNTILIEWPPQSGGKMEIPEVDRAVFFTIEEAKINLEPYQCGIIEVFEEFLKEKGIISF